MLVAVGHMKDAPGHNVISHLLFPRTMGTRCSAS
jgi:hypothetical protein